MKIEQLVRWMTFNDVDFNISQSIVAKDVSSSIVCVDVIISEDESLIFVYGIDMELLHIDYEKANDIITYSQFWEVPVLSILKK